MNRTTYVVSDEPIKPGERCLVVPEGLGGKRMVAWAAYNAVNKQSQAEKLLAKVLRDGLIDFELSEEIKEYFDGFMWESLLEDEDEPEEEGGQ